MRVAAGHSRSRKAERIALEHGQSPPIFPEVDLRWQRCRHVKDSRMQRIPLSMLPGRQVQRSGGPGACAPPRRVTGVPAAGWLAGPATGCPRRTRLLPSRWHCAVRAAPGDRMLSDAEWAHIAAQIMDRTGRKTPAGDDRGVRRVAVRQAADHVHIVATLARQDVAGPRPGTTSTESGKPASTPSGNSGSAPPPRRTAPQPGARPARRRSSRPGAAGLSRPVSLCAARSPTRRPGRADGAGLLCPPPAGWRAGCACAAALSSRTR
jgi:hypothetical protein